MCIRDSLLCDSLSKTFEIEIMSDTLEVHAAAISSYEGVEPVSYTHLRAHETPEHLVCRLMLEKKKLPPTQMLPLINIFHTTKTNSHQSALHCLTQTNN